MNTKDLETNTQMIERLTRERDEARAACAEMRRALNTVHALCTAEDPDWTELDGDTVANALSLHAGKGWLSPEVRQRLHDSLVAINEYWNGAPEAAVDAIEHVQELAQEALTTLDAKEGQ